MAAARPLVSPYVQEFSDFEGNIVRITVAFGLLTRIILAVTVFRDAGCRFARIALGVGPDGTPDTSQRTVEVPDGETVLSTVLLDLLAGRGVRTAEEFAGYQITAVL